MSSRASFVTVPAANQGDALLDTHIMQVVGGRYEATPVTVADGAAKSFAIDANGRQIVIGAEVNNSAIAHRGLAAMGQYSATPPTYDDGDAAYLQVDANGYLRVNASYDTNAGAVGVDTLRVHLSNENISLLTFSKNAGAVDATTIRAQLTTESLANVYEVQGDAADNAAASGNPVRAGGVYNSVLPTYDNGDAGSLQLDVNGYLLVRDPVVGARSVNAGAADATTLRVVTASDSTIIARGTDADNAAPTVNPLAVAGRYNSALPTYDDGDVGYIQLDSNGRARVVVESEARTGLAIQDTAYNAYSGSSLPGNASNPLQLVASTSAAIKKISVWDTGGVPCELMTGAAAAEVRKMVLGPGADGEYEVDIPAGTRVSIRRLDSASALAVGDITINFLG